MMRVDKKSPRSRHQKTQSNGATRPSILLAGTALSIAAVLSYLVLDTQKRLVSVQDELKWVSERAGEANARIIDLEHAAVGLTLKLKQTSFRRDELQNRLHQANSKIAQLNQIVDSANASHEDAQSRLETMRNELESVRHLAEQEAVESKKQISALKSTLVETHATLQARQTELQLAHSDVAQLRSDLNAAKSEVAELRNSQRQRKETPNDQPAQLKPTHMAHELGSEARDYLIRTIVFEASGETEIGKAAVAHVILNRKMIGRWGNRIQDVVTSPWQFEPWMTRRSLIEKLSSDDPRYRDAAKIADAVLTGAVRDPTAGATHFLNPIVVRQRRGGSLPSWAEGDGQPIGRHVFYSPEGNDSLGRRAAARGLTTSQQRSFSPASPG